MSLPSVTRTVPCVTRRAPMYIAHGEIGSWYLARKLNHDEAHFKAKYSLGESAGEYAIHGGGVPIRVTNVEGVVAVVVVSGLSQDLDHMVVVEALEELGRGLE